MEETASLINQIKRPTSKVFKRFSVKRRQADGSFESSWQDLTKFVIRWGNFRWSIDTPSFGRLLFANSKIRLLNTEGTFNPNDNEDSFWNGYGDIQRTLVKVEAGFTHQTVGSDGIWINTEFPTATTLWTGIISGEIGADASGKIDMPLRPTAQIFRDYPANDIRGYTSGGMSSGAWFGLLRDHTDGAGAFVFRPFIGEATSTDWVIATGGNNYANLDTYAAADLHNLNCWQVTEKLAEAEQAVAFINNTGQFVWHRKTATASVQYEMHGIGSVDRTYGQTIKKIFKYGKKLESFYSRVAVRYTDADTNTSFVNTSLAFAVDGSNTAFNLGHRTFSIDNLWIANSAAAGSVASSVLTEISAQAEEINFLTSFIPHINIMDRISITFDSTDFVTGRSLWDINDWGDNSDVTDLIWDNSRGDGIVLNSANFKVLSVNVNLDKMESTYIAKQL